MKEILQKSDFALKISFNDIFGRNIAVKKFVFSYSTPLSEPIEFRFDQTSGYSDNCKPEADGVILVFDAPKFNTGVLRVKRTYSIADPLYPDQTKDFVEPIKELPIRIVDLLTLPSNDAGMMSTEVVVVHSSTDNGQLVISDVVIVSGIKGTQGLPGAPGFAIDYSSLVEQQIPGQFWVGRDGTKKPLYGRRIRASAQVLFTGGKYYAFMGSLQPVDCLFSTTGVVYYNYPDRTNQEMLSSCFGKGGIFVHQDFSSFVPNSIIAYFDDLHPSLAGTTLTVDFFAIYTKI